MDNLKKVYHDYGYVREEDVVDAPGDDDSDEPPAAPPHAKSSRGQDKKFPTMLHYILSDLEKEGKSDIMGWLPHGRAFIVRDQKRMESEILPNWFRQKKFHSFQRQLNIYGFNRLSTGPDKGSYYHELFLRGKPYLCDRIIRTKIKGEGPRKPNNPESEPTLSLYPPMPPSGGIGQSYAHRRDEDCVGDGSDELDVRAARAQIDPAAAAASVLPSVVASSLGVAQALPPANLSRMVPMFSEPLYAVQSTNPLFGAEMVGPGGMIGGVGGGLVYPPSSQPNMYLQSLLRDPLFSTDGSWGAAGDPAFSARFAPCFGVPAAVDPMLQSTQLHLLQRRLQQEQQLRSSSFPLHALRNPAAAYEYGPLGDIPASGLVTANLLSPQSAEVATARASSATTDPDSTTSLRHSSRTNDNTTPSHRMLSSESEPPQEESFVPELTASTTRRSRHAAEHSSRKRRGAT